MRPLRATLILFLLACHHETESTDAGSPPPTPRAWAPHAIPNPTPASVCDELREGGIVSRCVNDEAGSGVAIALLVGQPNANHVNVLQFSSPETLEAFMKEEGDAISHTSLRFNMAIEPRGSVPEETKEKFAAALDAL